MRLFTHRSPSLLTNGLPWFTLHQTHRHQPTADAATALIQASVAVPARNSHTDHGRRDRARLTSVQGSRGHDQGVPPPDEQCRPPLSVQRPPPFRGLYRRTHSTSWHVPYTPRLIRPNSWDTTTDVSSSHHHLSANAHGLLAMATHNTYAAEEP